MPANMNHYDAAIPDLCGSGDGRAYLQPGS